MGDTNIPTDLLRTLVAVVDQRSFTRAARTLGVTQPAVSAQIKRLQMILGNELFDKSGPGVNLTKTGEVVVTYSRRLLSINDLILHVAAPDTNSQTIRVGVPADFVGVHLAGLLADFRRRWPHLRFGIYQGNLALQLAELRQGKLDIAVGLSVSEPDIDARHRWIEQMVWLRGPATQLNPAAPVPLVSLREDCVYHRAAVAALDRAGRPSELVLTAPTMVSLAAAVEAGLGIMALARCRVEPWNLTVWHDAPLPKLPVLSWGVYVGEGGERGPIEFLADSIAANIKSVTLEAAKQAAAPVAGKGGAGKRAAEITARDARPRAEEKKNQRLVTVSARS